MTKQRFVLRRFISFHLQSLRSFRLHERSEKA